MTCILCGKYAGKAGDEEVKFVAARPLDQSTCIFSAWVCKRCLNSYFQSNKEHDHIRAGELGA